VGKRKNPVTMACSAGCGKPYLQYRPEHTAHYECTVNNKKRDAALRKAEQKAAAAAVEVDQLKDESNIALKAALKATLLKLEKEKNKTAVLIEAVYETVSTELKTQSIPAVPPPVSDKRKHGEEVAVAVLADWQLFKVTKTYNAKVCEQRIEKFSEKVIELTRIQRADHPVRKCHIWCLGDLVEGELIFPGQAHLIEGSVYRASVVDGPRIKVNFIRRLLTEFDSVHVTVVPGNHGRAGGRQHRDYHPQTNFDRILSMVAKAHLSDEPRVTWNIADDMLEGGWYAIDDIGGYKTLLFHGDQIIGGLTTENHLKKMILGWKSGALDGSFNDAFLGHFHVIKRFTFNSTAVRVSGSPESDNGYAIRSLGSVSRPSQHLQFVKPGFGVTAEYDIWLD